MRTAYVLTVNSDSERSQFSKEVLESVGFTVKFFNCIPHKNKVLSNKLSMLEIYKTIANGEDEWCYVFEDDINVLEKIELPEIIEYEKLTNCFFYLGVCIAPYFTTSNFVKYNETINEKIVKGVSGGIRGLHAIGISKNGAEKLLEFSKDHESTEYMDIVLEKFSEIHKAPVIRYDLESYISGHKGIFFQDRNRFPSSI